MSVTTALSRPGGWLVGGPLSYAGPSQPPSSTRVRSLELALSVALADQKLSATASAALLDASYGGPTANTVGWADARLQPLLGSVFAAISPATPPASSSLGALLTALQALGIAVTDAQGAVGISADAVNALTVDPVGYLAPKVGAALASLGFAAGAAGSYSLPLGTLPLEVFAQTAPATIGLRTAAAGAGLGLTSGIGLEFTAGLPLATMTPQVSATLTAGPATLGYASGAVTLQVPPGLGSLQLYPVPSAASIETALAAALPGFLLSSAASALIGAMLGPGYVVSGITSFLSSPGQWLVGSNALGNGTVLDPAKVSQLLTAFGTLPAGLTLSASGTNPTVLALATGTPLGGVLSVSLGVSIDATRHLAPAGTLGIEVPLTGTWPSLTLTLGVSSSGVSLVVAPGGQTPIQLLPTFSGFGALAAAAEALLPQALDGLLAALPAGPITPLALEVATALDLYDPAGGFAAHAAQLVALTSGNWMATVQDAARSAFLAAVSAVFNDPGSPLHGALPGTIAVSGSAIGWSYPVAGGSLGIGTGWDSSGPTVSFTAAGLAPGQLAADGVADRRVRRRRAHAGRDRGGLAGNQPGHRRRPAARADRRRRNGHAGPAAARRRGREHAGDHAAARARRDRGVRSRGRADRGVRDPARRRPADHRDRGRLRQADVDRRADDPAGAVGREADQGGVRLAAAVLAVHAAAGRRHHPGRAAAGGHAGHDQARLLPAAVARVRRRFGQDRRAAGRLDPAHDRRRRLAAGLGAVRRPGHLARARRRDHAVPVQHRPAACSSRPELLVAGLGIGLAGSGDTPLLDASGFRVGAVDAYLAFQLDLLRRQRVRARRRGGDRPARPADQPVRLGVREQPGGGQPARTRAAHHQAATTRPSTRPST